MKTTIPAAQRLARGERVDDDDVRRAARRRRPRTLAGFDLGEPLVCADQRPRARRRLRPDARVGHPLRRAARDLRARGGRARPLSDRQRDGAAAAPDPLGARPRAAAHGAADRRERARGDRPGERASSRPTTCWPTALDTADAIAANAPLAVRATRRGVRELLHLPLDDAYRRQEELGRPLRRTDDAREAQRAFVEKRRPRWTGR